MQAGARGENEKTLRGKGRGSRFCVLGRSHWASLHKVKSRNQLNLYATFLALLAGTGSDNRLTKWSISACEEHLGLGKPRARVALEELIEAGLVERVDGVSRLTPQYRLPSVEGEEDPIFLPVQIVTGFAGEASVLRRARETGDALLLRMLIDLYGLIQVDATFGLPLAELRQGGDDEAAARKIAEYGIYGLWALKFNVGATNASGGWAQTHWRKGAPNNGWQDLWERLRVLQKIGALVFEPWVFESAALDAEPMFPVDPGVQYTMRDEDEVSTLTRLLKGIAEQLTADREYLLERFDYDVLVPLPLHQQTPFLRGVAKLRIEADTPSRRLAYARRMKIVESRTAAYQTLLEDVRDGRYDRPLGAAS